MKAYISSTYADLRPFREAAFEQIMRMSVQAIGMEYFAASGTPVLEQCLAAVRESDIYVLILGHRYGFVPEGHDRSITHLEYEEAVRLRHPILAFVLSDEVPVPASSIEVEPRLRTQLEQFKNEVIRASIVERIETVDGFRAALAAALFRLLRTAPTREPSESPRARLEACQRESEQYRKVIDDLTAKLRRVVPAEPIWRGRTFRLDELLCFALLPFQERFFEVYESAVAPAARDLGLRALHAGEIFGNREVVEDIWDSICAARVVVVDVTGRNPNVFYELGICHTLGKECIVITQDKADVPFDIRHRRFVEYRSDGLTLLRTTLRKTLQKVISHPDEPAGSDP
jgi:hypothetical protein